MNIRALVVDDEKPLVNLLRSYLEREGFEVHQALDGLAALEIARQVNPDVVVLDWMLPGLDGAAVLRELRRFSQAYVIMLTARAEEMDKIVGLSVGADDYVTKPFSPRELVARIHAMLRRPRIATDARPAEVPPIEAGDLVIDSARREVLLGGEQVTLTALEFDLLMALASRPGVVLTRDQLLHTVWGDRYFGSDHVVDVHVANVRKKLEADPAHPEYIQTVRGVGYRLVCG